MQDTNITTADYFDAMRTTEAFLPSLRSLDISLLPAAVQAIARLIGLPATLQLVENFGGLTLRLPVGAREAGQQMLADLARRIGPEAAQILRPALCRDPALCAQLQARPAACPRRCPAERPAASGPPGPDGTAHRAMSGPALPHHGAACMDHLQKAAATGPRQTAPAGEFTVIPKQAPHHAGLLLFTSP